MRAPLAITAILASPDSPSTTGISKSNLEILFFPRQITAETP